MKRFSPGFLTALVLGVSVLFQAMGLPASDQSAVLKLDRLTTREAKGLRVKNVVMMIPDGMGVGASTLGRWYKFAKTGVNSLVFDDLVCGLVRTYWATGLITDSAPSAAAMATGFKTSYGAVSLRPAKVTMPDVPALLEGQALTPVATVLEAARSLGLATGLVVTCEFPHATPAGFSSHYTQRSAMDLLAEQQVYQGMDVVLGGGRKYLNPQSRKDKENLVKVLEERGYLYVTDTEAMRAARPGRLWGSFAEAGMQRDIDRDLLKEPSLVEMTQKALTVLSRNPKGFFLMVEGSQIDWGAHANDPIGTATEVLGFDRAVAAVLEFAEKDGQTAVIIAADHSTGGFSIGNPEVGDLPWEKFLPITKAKMTATKAAALLAAGEPKNLAESGSLISDALGVDDLRPAEVTELDTLLKERNAKRLELFLGRVVSRRVGAGWAFTGHGGEDVALYIRHPRGLRLGGVIQNTDIAAYISKCLGFDLRLLTDRLFVPAAAAFSAVGAKTRVDITDPENPVFLAVRAGQTLRLPVNKSYAEWNGKAVELGGVIVTTGAIGAKVTDDPSVWFVPKRAVDLFK
jgi:alkaline phosphatase